MKIGDRVKFLSDGGYNWKGWKTAKGKIIKYPNNIPIVRIDDKKGPNGTSDWSFFNHEIEVIK
jgi:hypothetical protein